MLQGDKNWRLNNIQPQLIRTKGPLAAFLVKAVCFLGIFLHLIIPGSADAGLSSETHSSVAYVLCSRASSTVCILPGSFF